MNGWQNGFNSQASWNNGGPNPMYPRKVPFHAPQQYWTFWNWTEYYMFFGPFILIGYIGLAIWNAALPWEPRRPFNSASGLWGCFLLLGLPLLPLVRWLSKKAYGIR